MTTYTFSVHGFPEAARGPSFGAYQAIFGLVAVLGLLSLLVSAPFRNFRFDEAGQRIPLSRSGAPA